MMLLNADVGGCRRCGDHLDVWSLGDNNNDQTPKWIATRIRCREGLHLVVGFICE